MLITRMLVSQCDVGTILAEDVKTYKGITLVAKDFVLVTTQPFTNNSTSDLIPVSSKCTTLDSMICLFMASIDFSQVLEKIQKYVKSETKESTE